MEKSIEDIWKSGFLDQDALVAPKVNDLYSRKSQHVVEKFQRMFRWNLRAIALGSILGFAGLLALQMPITAIALSLVLVVVFVVNRRELHALEKTDRSENSYAYLSYFDRWMKRQISLNARMARIYYPAIFLGMAFGLWFSAHGPVFYERLAGPSDADWTLNGIPGVWIFPILLIAALLGLLGSRLYRMELNGIYGDVLKKLDELLSDMEELR